MEQEPTDLTCVDASIRLKVIGVGGAGCNAVRRLSSDALESISTAVVNTDLKSLNACPVQEQVMIGQKTTRGLSAGGESEIGRMAAEEDRDSLIELVDKQDVVFLIAGLGGGTGSGAMPVLAELANRKGAMVFCFVTMPFKHEGNRRELQAQNSLTQIRKHSNAVITLPNDFLVQHMNEQDTLLKALAAGDTWMAKGVISIWSMLFETGIINADFASLKKVFSQKRGRALFGHGFGEGANAMDAAMRSLDKCPMLHLPDLNTSQKADALLVHIAGGLDLTMTQVNRMMDALRSKFGCRDQIILNAVTKEELQQSVSITVIGTTDLGSKPQRLKRTPAALLSEISQEPVHRESKRGKRNSKGQNQSEFNFPNPDENRGIFEETEQNLYEGEDLDVPAFVRRGISIHIQ